MKTTLIIFYLLCIWIPLQAANAQSTNASSVPTKVIAVIPEDFPPQYQLDEKGNPSGFAVELLDAIAAKAGLDIEYLIKPTWNEVFSSIKNGEATLLPNVGISKTRATNLDFTTSIEQLPISIFVNSNNDSIHSIEDLFGKKAIVVKKNIAIQTLKKYPSIDLVIVEDIEDGFTPLLSHKVAAIIYPEAWVWARANKIGIADHIKVTGHPLIHVKRAIAVKKGNPKLLKKINDALTPYLASTQYKTLEDRWKHVPTHTEIAPSIIMLSSIFISLLLAFGAMRIGLIRKKSHGKLNSIDPTITTCTTTDQPINEYGRASLMIGIISIVIIGSVLSATYMFYQSAFESTRNHLIENVRIHKSAIQALLKHETKFSTETSTHKHSLVLDDFIQLIAHVRSKNIGNGIELELGERVGDNIEFLFTHHKTQEGTHKTVLFHSQNAAPMRLALQGQSGTVIGRDYKGDFVLAAYESIEGHNMGIVNKIELAAIRAPFIKSAIILSAVISLLMITSIFLITRLGNPIILSLRKSLRDLTLSEQQLRLHYNQHIVGMMTFDKNANIIEWNIACEKIFGYSYKEAIGQPVTNLILQDVSPHIMNDLWHKLINQSGGHHSIIINNTKSGEHITCEWFNSPIIDINNEVTGVSSIVLDISSKAEANKALKLDKQRNLLLLKLMNNSTEDESDFINDALKSSTQLTSSKIGYMHFLHEDGETLSSFTYNQAHNKNTPITHEQFSSTESTINWVDKIQQAKPALQNNYSSHRDYKNIPADHEKIMRHLSVPITHEGKNTGIVGVGNKEAPYTDEDSKQLQLYVQSMWNIIIRQRTQKKLTENQAHYRTLVESSAAIPWEMDLNSNRFTYVGPQAVAVLGYPVEEWYQENFWPEHLHPEDTAAAIEYCKRSTNQGQDHDFKYRMVTKDGSEVWILDYVKVIIDKDKPSRLQGFMFDITEHEHQEKHLRHSQKMDAIGTLTGGIAHDYNNMLGIILGYSEMLADHVSDNPKLTKYVKRISQAGKRGTKLTKKLLQFSQKSEATAEGISINELIKENEDMLATTLTPRITLITHLADDLAQVYIDKSGLEDAILNLSINAMHAMPNGGKLEFKTDNILLTNLEAIHYQLNEGSYVRLSLTDNGTGMDKATQEKIFDPFFSTKGDKGTGLGMFQVYGLIHKAGGSINVYSALGHGTQISILLPAYQSAIDDSNVLEATNDDCLNGNEKVLVVDDEPALCQLAEDILNSKGYQITTAESAEMALEKLSTHHFDLVLSDIIMPGMNGYQLANEIQKHHPKIKIQLTSGFDDHENIKATDKLLHDNLIHKPYTSNKLLIQIRNMLDA